MNIKKAVTLILTSVLIISSISLPTRIFAADLSSVDLSGKLEKLYEGYEYNLYGQYRDNVYVVENNQEIGVTSVLKNSFSQQTNLYSTTEEISRAGSGGPEMDVNDQFLGNGFAFTKEKDFFGNNLVEVNFENNQVINQSDVYILFQNKLREYFKLESTEEVILYLVRTNSGKYWATYCIPQLQSGSGWGVANEDFSVVLEDYHIRGIDITTDTLYGDRYGDNYPVRTIFTIKDNMVRDLSVENVPKFNHFYIKGETIALTLGQFPASVALGTITDNKVVVNKTVDNLLDGTTYVKQDTNGSLWAIGGGKLYLLTKDDAIEMYKLFDSEGGNILTRAFEIYDQDNFTIQSIDMRDGNTVISTYRRPPNTADINNDGIIDIFDIAELAKHYNDRAGQTNWNIKYDLNQDGTVNIYDFVLVSRLMNNIPVQSISLNKITDILTIGDTDTLIATILPNNATNKNVKWTSSDLSIVTVDGTGKVTAAGAGTATITVTTAEGNKTAACIINVIKKGYVKNPEREIDLKARSAPGLSGSILGYLYNYEKVKILGSTVDAAGNEWDKIIYDINNDGYYDDKDYAYVSHAYIQPYTTPTDNVVDIAAKITKQFEVGDNNQIAGTFDGQGLSLGYFQWCIGQETLQPLLNRMDRQYNSEMRSIFGTNYDTIHSMILDTPANQLEWAQSINDSTDNIIEPWYSQLVNLSNNQHFINIEKDAEVYYVKQAMIICDKYKLRTVRGFALAFDIVVQNGSINSEAAKTIDTSLIQAPNMNEKSLLGVIANAVADSSVNNSEDIRSRKMAIVSGQGTVHGNMFNLDRDYELSDDYWR